MQPKEKEESYGLALIALFLGMVESHNGQNAVSYFTVIEEL
tara:strand:+ start:41 stop:163 length:123 start_codon:yes stop_codon:yes gene_type:complete